MKDKEYVALKEVSKVCKKLGLQDWSKFTSTKIALEDARKIQEIIGSEASEVAAEVFQKGLEVELEHGLIFPDANVTNNHPILTGKIVLAHLKETLDYYERLEVMELEAGLANKANESCDNEIKVISAELKNAQKRLSNIN